MNLTLGWKMPSSLSRPGNSITAINRGMNYALLPLILLQPLYCSNELSLDQWFAIPASPVVYVTCLCLCSCLSFFPFLV